jgi:CDP-glucose 4,6-dehydratase
MSKLSRIFKNKKVLVTGHTGFKGSWLCSWLSMYGADLYGISDRIFPDPCIHNALDLKIKSKLLKVQDLKSLSSIIEEIKPDFIFHLAAQALVKDSYKDPINTWTTNTMGTANVLESLKKINNKCVSIFITSDKVYDNVEWEFGYRETDTIGGPDPYSASKGGAELSIKSYYHSFFKDSNIRIGVGRAGNVIGGGDWAKDRIVPDIIRSWISKQDILLRNPNATRPWQHVLEPISGYLNLAMSLYESNSLQGEAFNFGPNPNKNKTVKELIIESQKWINSIGYIDDSKDLNKVYESKLLKLNIDKSNEILGWSSVWDFEKTIEKTILWYKEFYSKKDLKLIKNFTLDQIKDYIDNAFKINLPWTK